MKKKFPSQEKPLNPGTPPGQGASSELRQRAETRVLKQSIHPGVLSSQDSEHLIHELQVHQIELEMQNEELSQSRAEVEIGLERYTDLYDFAPVGYITLSNNGIIRQVNLIGAEMLGVESSKLIGRRFRLFITIESLPVFIKFMENVFSSQVKQTCEVSLLKDNHLPQWVQIEGLAATNGQEVHVVLTDITDRWLAEDQVKHLNLQLEQRIKERTFELENANRNLEQKIEEGNKTQESLRDLYSRFLLIADNTRDWEYWLDQTGSYRYFSPSCKRITGYKPDEFFVQPQPASTNHPSARPGHLEKAHRRRNQRKNRSANRVSHPTR